MNESGAKKRVFASLDGIRGLAAIFVAMRHVPYFGHIWFQETYLAVDLFFILSGVVIANAYEDKLRSDLSAVEFIWMRIVRIYPLYILGTLVGALCWIVGGKTEEGSTLAIVIFALLLLPNLSSYKSFPLNGPAWSLLSEIVANVFYAFLVRRLNTRMVLAIMAVSFGGLLSILYLNHQLDFGYYTRHIPFGFFRVGYSFFAGVLLYRFFNADLRWHHVNMRGGHAVPWLILGLLFLIFYVSPSGVVRGIFDLAVVTVVFPAIIFIAMIFNPGTASSGLFRVLGVISYPIYVMHVPLSKWIPVVFANQQEMLLSRPLWLGLSFMVVLLPLSWLLDKYYDLPVRRAALKFGLPYLKTRALHVGAATNGSN